MGDFLGIPLPVYCERSKLEFFVEPLNAISNIAFLFAGLGIYRLLIKNNLQQLEYKVLLILIFLIGPGSFLWHATRNSYTLPLDAIPTALSFTLIIYIFLSRLMGNKLLALLIAALLLPTRFFISSFASTDTISSLIRNAINAITFLVIIVWALKKYGKIALEGFGILLVYLLAITMRGMDLQVCQAFPLGTHFLWHILNALAAYLAVKFIIKLGLTKHNYSSPLLK